MPQLDIPRLHHLGFIQLRLMPGDPAANLQRLAQLLGQLAPPPHSLIVLPELWATGFAYQQLVKLQDEVAKLPDRLQELAEKYDVLLAGSLPERAAGGSEMFFNTLTVIGREGVFGSYRKRHVFPGEELAFRSWLKTSPPIVTPEGRFGCLVCYDLRFPELARRQCQQGADLLLCSAEWPSARIPHWRALAIARAIENQTFMVGCNGVGINGQLTLGGHSLIVSPAGEVLHEAGEGEEAKIVAIDWQAKREAQAVFQSFTAEPYRCSSEKIGTPDFWVAQVELRCRVGQRVVYALVDGNLDFSRNVELLESARERGDFLLAGVLLPGEREEPPKSAGEHIALLQLYAALGCVDAVFAFLEMSPDAERRLQAFAVNLP